MTAAGVIAPVALPSRADRAAARHGVAPLPRVPLPLPDLPLHVDGRCYLRGRDGDEVGDTVATAAGDPSYEIACRIPPRPGIGYVHPVDAAAEVLDELLQPFLEWICSGTRSWA